MTTKETRRAETPLLLLWLGINLVIGLLIVGDYGLSVDEPAYYLYAERSVEAYRSAFGRLYEPDYGPSNHRYYGPAFILIVEGFQRLLDSVSVDIDEIILWHYAYFVLFQLTGLGLYALARRWFSRWAAWGVLILFVSQPLLWGHAFINPKDIPFMFAFTFSILAGFRMVDSLGQQAPIFSLAACPDFASRWRGIDPHKRKNFRRGLALILVGFLVSRFLADFVIEKMIRFLFSADSGSWAANIRDAVAANAASIPVRDYVAKAQNLYGRVELTALGLSLGILLVHLFSKKTRQTSSARLHTRPRPLKNLLRFIIAPKIILAGIALGFATAIRVLGPLAGLIVCLFLLAKARRQFLPVSLAYFVWAGLTTYLAWPYLWLAPISRYFETVGMMSRFPWTGEVLFNGVFYSPAALPFSYLPVLMHIQFTEVFMILFYIGVGLAIWRLKGAGLKIDLLLLIGLGSVLPIMGLIALRSPMYDNFRQIFFLLPGLFLVAGLALEAVFDHLQPNWLQAALILAIAAPGLLSIIRLHPYQYIYYNSLTGGQAGAQRQFEMDYWQTSTRELTLALNQFASPEDKIIVVGTLRLVRSYIRPDLFLERAGDNTHNLDGDYDYAILPARWNNDQSYPQAEIIKSIERNGAILGVIKRVKGESYEH